MTRRFDFLMSVLFTILLALAALFLCGGSFAQSTTFNTTTGRQYNQPCPISAGCTGATSTSPPTNPLPIKALTISYANEAVTGTTVNKLVKIVNDPPVAILLGTSDTNLAFGIVSSGAGTTGSANVDVYGETSCVFDGATTSLDYVVSSTTTAGDCHDSGSATTFPVGVSVIGRVLSTNASGGTYTTNIFTPDVAPSASGPGGKGNTLEVNGSNAKVIANLNHTTPAAGAGTLNVTFSSSNSGNTTSITANFPISGNMTTVASAAASLAGASPGTTACADGSGNVAAASGTCGGSISGLTTNKIPKAASATSLSDSSVTDNGTNVSTTENLVTTAAVETGSSPPTCTVGSAGAWCGAEGSAPTAASGVDDIWFDSSHLVGLHINGGSAGSLVNVAPGVIHSTGNTAAISTATLCASSAGACNTAGQYHVHWDFIETGTACSVPATGGVTFLFTWTDSNATAHSAVSLGMDDASAINAVSQTFHFQTSLAAAWASGDFNFSTNGSVVQYATGYTACGTGTGTYQLDAAVTRLQ